MGLKAQPKHKHFEIYTLIHVWKQYFQHLNWDKIVTYIIILIFFIINYYFNHKLAPLTSHVLVKDYRHHLLTKYEGKGTRTSIFKLFGELGRICECNLGFSKIPISHLLHELAKTWKYAKPKKHFKIQVLNLWLKWKNLCPNLSVTIENKMGNSLKKGLSHFKININDWDIPFPSIFRIFQWIGENFQWGKWNESIGSDAYATKYLAKRSWRYLFPAYV